MTLRKLGEKFSERYRFKRLLTTDPEITYQYHRRDLAIDSIVPIKELVVDDGAATKRFKKITPFDKGWQRRVAFPEQIPELTKYNFSLWIVTLTGPFPQHLHHQTGRPTRECAEVEIIRIDNPAVVHLYPDQNYRHRTEMVNPDKLDRIDRNKFASYFLDGKQRLEQQMHPLNLNQCGILPNGPVLLNAAFYDHDIARLYAQSLNAYLTNLDFINRSNNST